MRKQLLNLRDRRELLRVHLIAAGISTVVMSSQRVSYWLVFLPIFTLLFGTIMFFTNRLRAKIRSPFFLVTVLLNAASILLALGFGFLIMFWIYRTVGNFYLNWSPIELKVLEYLRSSMFRSVLSVSFVLTCIVVTAEQISKKLGQKVLLNWVFGRYYRPRLEERIFLFLDMKGSTSHAESLGDLRFSALLKDFLGDITDPLLETEGEISHYIGDSALITWEPRRGLKSQNCLRFIDLFEASIAARAPHYVSNYGVVPEFKAALHIGEVVTTDVGVLKSEIVFHGDAVNSAARIEALCSELNRPVLISDDLVRRLELDGTSIDLLGSHRVKGKANELKVWGYTTPRLPKESE